MKSPKGKGACWQLAANLGPGCCQLPTHQPTTARARLRKLRKPPWPLVPAPAIVRSLQQPATCSIALVEKRLDSQLLLLFFPLLVETLPVLAFGPRRNGRRPFETTLFRPLGHVGLNAGRVRVETHLSFFSFRGKSDALPMAFGADVPSVFGEGDLYRVVALEARGVGERKGGEVPGRWVPGSRPRGRVVKVGPSRVWVRAGRPPACREAPRVAVAAAH
mmetsp:Transcript_435/g.958  ORF Transcript_435/g.958 Transcript_435/m.958 type:complete len:219 (-) Transcript_435:100-756(-)